MTHTCANDQGQRSVGSKDRVETDGQTDGGDCITSRAIAEGITSRTLMASTCCWCGRSLRLGIYYVTLCLRISTSHPKIIWEERVALAQLRNKVSIGFNGTLKFTPKTAPSLSTITTPSNTPIPRPTPSPPQTASRSSQPFCYSTLSGPTERHTDRQMG